ncbi:MAG TPA: hypothetical protein VM100_00040 [Longimicrobiales bacterium]|nr:hypothetical protein [Longimicrobiales bacterium]
MMKKNGIALVLGLCACSSGTAPPDETYWIGEYNFAFNATATGGSASNVCTRTYQDRGSIKMHFHTNADGLVEGTFLIPLDTRTNLTANGGTGCDIEESGIFSWQGDVTGTPNNLMLQEDITFGSIVERAVFRGSVTNGVLTGTLTFTESGKDPAGLTRNGIGSGNLTLGEDPALSN